MHNNTHKRVIKVRNCYKSLKHTHAYTPHTITQTDI